MKCKDIPTQLILDFINKRPGEWHNWCFGDEKDVRHAMPNGFNLPPKLVLAKMRKLVNSGLIDGCACGCRGDFRTK